MTILTLQKILGIVACVLSTLVMLLTGEGTQACLLIPLGLYMTCTKEVVLIFQEKEDEEADD